jgi:hypothetical protein
VTRRVYRRLGHVGNYVAGDLRTFASNAGFVEPDLTTAVAIALAESGGNPNAYNPEPQKNTPVGKGSVGLWQIYLAKHPEFSGQNLLDPQTNANAAFLVYAKAGGFSPWTGTFGSGKYQNYLQQAAPPVTIDASTGQVIDDSTLTPVAIASGAGFTFPTTGNPLLDLTLAGVGALLLADLLNL